ncbi:hypothetical protein [Paludisphaera mucosa]|uniref:Carboxypeptidase regulatory-like domain-containing protein n=1 Tax=Paludisphaera mucosa TaxID=3030827 RepID=A0ABT6F967_9BACT|nr:hypothetical protein [Paludisphaera mucosa]MDG3004132.1 hypothetical protein [Paludisphaera mucosa]
MLYLGLMATDLGCSGGARDGRVPVSGEVVVDGRPLDAGAVSLERASEGRQEVVGSRIRAGAFAIPQSKGPTPGVYRVRIYASGREQAPPPPGVSDRARRPMVERIPAEYNARSTKTVEIRPGRGNHLKFQIATTAPGG